MAPPTCLCGAPASNDCYGYCLACLTRWEREEAEDEQRRAEADCEADFRSSRRPAGQT